MSEELKSRYSVVDMGPGNTGLAGTMGFTLYKINSSASTAHTARTTSNIIELGSGTGVYLGTFTVTDIGESVIVLWDNGSSSYAVEDKQGSFNTIRDATDKIEVIQNTIKNNADFSGEIMLRLAKVNKLEMIPEQIGKAFVDTMKDYDFSDQLKESKLEFSKMEKGLVRQIDTIHQKNSEIGKVIKNAITTIKFPEKDNKDVLEAVKNIKLPKEFDPTDIKSTLKTIKDNQQYLNNQLVGIQTMIATRMDTDTIDVNIGKTNAGLQKQAQFLQELSIDKNLISNKIHEVIVALHDKYATVLETVNDKFSTKIEALMADLNKMESKFDQINTQINRNFGAIQKKMDMRNRVDLLPYLNGKRRA